MLFIRTLTLFLAFILAVVSFDTKASFFSKTPYPLSGISHKHKEGWIFGSLIEELGKSQSAYDAKTPIISHFLKLSSVLKKDKGTRFLSCQEVINFCDEQDLISYMVLSEEKSYGSSPEGKSSKYRETYSKTYGVEFLTHGPVEDLAEQQMRLLLEQYSSVNYMDFGAGYGSFVRDLLEKFPGQTIHADLSETLSAQCYHAAEKLKDFPNVRIWPNTFFSNFVEDYSNQDRTYHFSTCLNVLHFMTEFQVSNAIKRIFDVTQSGGFHLCVVHSAYTGNKDYPERPTGYTEDWRVVGSILARPSFHFFKTDYLENFFEESGFTVIESGYFGYTSQNDKEFCYVMVQKPIKTSQDCDREFEDYSFIDF